MSKQLVQGPAALAAADRCTIRVRALSAFMPPVVQVTDDTLVTIFKTILDWHLTSNGFPEPCKKLGAGIIAATLDIYSQSMIKLLPTPTKSNYTFNLRDFARVIQVSTTAG